MTDRGPEGASSGPQPTRYQRPTLADRDRRAIVLRLAGTMAEHIGAMRDPLAGLALVDLAELVDHIKDLQVEPDPPTPTVELDVIAATATIIPFDRRATYRRAHPARSVR